MLLNKIHLLKNKILFLSKVFQENSKNILLNTEKNSVLEIKNDELSARVSHLEELVKVQNFLNESNMNQIKANERERVKIVKDIQIIVATLKDVYNLVQENYFDNDMPEEDFAKKNKKNNTYH
tara:strand:+ start:596 stop:964 length:369 start_codon:yes stop_codon:yes gene_type:complete